MKRFIEGDNRGQSTLFPEGLEDLVDGNNPVRVMPTLSLQTFGHLPQPAQPFIASLFSPKTAPAPSCQAVAGGDTVKKSVSPNKRRNSDNGNSAAAQIFFYQNLSTIIEYPIQFSARRSARQHFVLRSPQKPLFTSAQNQRMAGSSFVGGGRDRVIET